MGGGSCLRSEMKYQQCNKKRMLIASDLAIYEWILSVNKTKDIALNVLLDSCRSTKHYILIKLNLENSTVRVILVSGCQLVDHSPDADTAKYFSKQNKHLKNTVAKQINVWKKGHTKQGV